jgi:hypothetical protein
MNQGSVTFSFDCEGKWGMTDILSPWDVNITRRNLLRTYEYILKTLNTYNIPATFAFVGAFTENREQFLDEILPNLSSENYTAWIDYSRCRITDESEEGWFMPELLDMVRVYDIHEIASHSYTHIPFILLNEEDAGLELSLIKTWADKNNINCKTLVYPRNIIRHVNLLKEYGILGYRDTPEVVTNIKLPKLVATLIEETWVYKKAQQLDVCDPVKVPGGVFINWRYNFRRSIIPTSLSLLKYKNMISDAKLRNLIAHFWLHPHNFITSHSTKRLFEKLCDEVVKQRDESSLVIKKQSDYLLG